MRSWKSILALILIACFIWWWYPSESKQAPDQQLVGHVKGMCKVMKKNVERPERGVDALFGYYGKNGPQMLQQFGDLLVLIERIEDDKAHDRRARKANQRIVKALQACERTAERFFTAVEDDPKARAKFERGIERFGRTLEILFSAADARSDVLDMRSPALRRLIAGPAQR